MRTLVTERLPRYSRVIGPARTTVVIAVLLLCGTVGAQAAVSDETRFVSTPFPSSSGVGW